MTCRRTIAPIDARRSPARSIGRALAVLALGCSAGARTPVAVRPAPTDAGAAVAARDAAPAGTCADPFVLAAPAIWRADRVGAAADGLPAGRYAFAVDVARESTLGFTVGGSGALCLTTACGDAATTVAHACNAPSQMLPGDLHARLSPGRYYATIESRPDVSRGGLRSLMVMESPRVTTLAADCREPVATGASAVIPSGQGRVSSACAMAFGRSRVFALDLAARSRVRLVARLTSPPRRTREPDVEPDDMVLALSVRRRCEDARSEVACLRVGDPPRRDGGEIAALLDAGSYAAIVSSSSGGWEDQGVELVRDVAPTAGDGAPGDTCAEAAPLPASGEVRGDTLHARDDAAVGGDGGADVYHAVTVPRRSRVEAWFEGGDFAPTLGLLGDCAAPPLAVARATSLGRPLSVVVPAGTYRLAVDGAAPGEFGRYHLRVRVDDAAPLEAACRAARPMTLGGSVRGGRIATPDRFRGSCVARPGAPESVYRLVLPRRMGVSFGATSTRETHYPVVYVRRDCLDPASEAFCGPNVEGSSRRFGFEASTELDAGTWFVFVDGLAEGHAGPFEAGVREGVADEQ
jgi:hypothetical protein